MLGRLCAWLFGRVRHSDLHDGDGARAVQERRELAWARTRMRRIDTELKLRGDK